MSGRVAKDLKSHKSGAGTFSELVKTRALVACKRFCCLCEKHSGVKMHCHHIIPVAKGGADTSENCIPLCLNCHAEVEAYNDQHPMGNKFRPEELRQRRDIFYKAIEIGPTLQNAAGVLDADRATFADLKACLPSTGTIQFIRHERYVSRFHESKLEELDRFCYDRAGPEHEFLDVELEAHRQALQSRAKDFSALLGQYIFSVGPQHDRYEIPTDWEDEKPELFHRVLKELGESADRLCEAYDQLIRLGRRKLA